MFSCVSSPVQINTPMTMRIAPPVATIAFARMTKFFSIVKRHYALIVAAGGAILIVMGVLILTGRLTQLNIEAIKLLDRLGLDFLTGI